MAENMHDIKRRITSVESTGHITNAMKLVAASKYRKAKEAYDRSNDSLYHLALSMSGILEDLEDNKDINNLFVEGYKDLRRTCFVIVSSNKGLCGGFNSNIFKFAEEEIAKRENDPMIITVGKKATDYFSKRGYDIRHSYDAPDENFRFSSTKYVTSRLLTAFEDGRVDEVVVIYTKFVNTLKQEPKARIIFPMELDFVKGLQEKLHGQSMEVEYGPDPLSVMKYLIPKFVEVNLYNAVMESTICENIARRTAMENASDNANEILEELNLTYNRARQAQITNELIEIVSGAEALK
ncbi:MAG: ATP synthase F1 subunit gamma [Clostridia bacterium]|nr:ATP synthase F1 subunit gamma [Clostridia bacterium]